MKFPPPLPPVVSVIMAAYNHEDHVADAILSVLDQTFTDLEIVVVDDASPDATAERIRAITDPRVKTRFLTKNSGVIVARLEALAIARGRYIAILNSDDVFLPEKLARQVAFLDANPGYGAVFSDVEVIDDAGLPFSDTDHFYSRIFTQANRSRFQWLRHFFYKGNCLCIPSVLIRRDCFEVIGLPDKRLTQISDLDLWIRMCLHYEIHVMPEKLVQFRIRSGNANLSAPRPDSLRRTSWENVKVLDRFLAIDNAEDLQRVFPESTAALRDRPAPSRDEIDYLIARLALDRDRHHHRAFAIETLYRLMGNAATARRLGERFGFTYKDFTDLTGRCEIFNPG